MNCKIDFDNFVKCEHYVVVCIKIFFNPLIKYIFEQIPIKKKGNQIFFMSFDSFMDTNYCVLFTINKNKMC